MKTVEQSILGRRSVRRYEREEISQAHMDLIYEAIRNTPTSYNGQQFSVVDVTDQPTKEKLYALTGAKQIKTCNHFLVFLIDYHKMELIAKEKGIELPDFTDTADGVIVGTIDASLAMMNAITMAESLGLGVCPVGFVRTAAPAEVSMLLKLPQKTFVVSGLSIGVPREEPDLKPKQPRELLVFSNEYNNDDASLTDYLKGYDAEIAHYNQTREGTKSDNDWAAHIVSYYREAMNYRELQALRSQGFDIKQ